MKNLFKILVFMFGLIISCSDRQNNYHYKEVELYISSETTWVKCCIPYEQQDMEVMIVKKKGEDKTFTLLLSEIQGFSYEKGYEYILLVKEKHLPNPPQDGKNVEYYLVKEISKQKK